METSPKEKELYDFKADPQCMELDNVADRYPDKVKRFSKELLDFKKSIPQGGPNASSGRNDYPVPKNK